MKKFVFLSLLLCGMTAYTFAHTALVEKKPIPAAIAVYKSLEDPLAYMNLPVSVMVTLKKKDHSTVFTETHEGTLSEISEYKFNIGTGTNQSPVYADAPVEQADSVCYKITVHAPDGDVEFNETEPIGSQPSSLSAETSHNAEALGGIAWGGTPVEPMELYVPPADITFCIPVARKAAEILQQPPTFDVIHMDRYVRPRTVPSAVNAMPVDYLVVGTGNPCPLYFGAGLLDQGENYYDIRPGSLAKYYNALGVSVPQEKNPVGHATAAIYGENQYDAQGVGGFFNGLSRGSYSQGRTGAFGICNNQTGNGAGVWGFVQYDAQQGSGNYAVLASANGRANAYAGYFDGIIAHTGDIMMVSDRRLKRNIETASLGLSTVMKLKPSTYEYIHNSSANLPDGLHHGFIAQEVEAVLPELVHEIIMPQSMDPDKMSSSGTEIVKGINYTELIPILTNAIQELNEKVEAMSAELAELRAILKQTQSK